MTYRSGLPVAESDDLLSNGRHGYVAERDGQIVGALTVLDMDCTRDGSTVSSAGVCAVAVLPHVRRGGIGSKLMANSVRLFEEDGYAVTSLYAYREPFYRQFGYEVGGTINQIRCPTHRLPKTHGVLPIRQLDADQFDELRPCFVSFAKRYSGMHTRCSDTWWQLNEADPPFVAYVAGDPIEAYIILQIGDGFWNDQAIREFIWTTHQGYDAMLEVISGLCINKSGAKWSEPGGSPMISRYYDQGLEVSQRRPISYRILNLPKTLAILKPWEKGCFTFAIQDEIIESNSGTWSIEFDDNSVITTKTNRPADFEFDVRTLTQAWLGEPSFDDLANDGLIRILNPNKLNAARALFRPCRVYCADAF
jgi:predicted acetyltransferase